MKTHALAALLLAYPDAEIFIEMDGGRRYYDFFICEHYASAPFALRDATIIFPLNGFDAALMGPPTQE
jgi:hypothetical protein